MSEAEKPPIITRERMYQTILSPVVTEKATAKRKRSGRSSGWGPICSSS